MSGIDVSPFANLKRGRFLEFDHLSGVGIEGEDVGQHGFILRVGFKRARDRFLLGGVQIEDKFEKVRDAVLIGVGIGS